MQAKHVAEALANSTLTKEKREELLTNMELIDGETKEIISANAVTEARLREELAETTLNDTEKDEIVTKILGTKANAGYTISWDALTVSIKKAIAATWEFLTTNPVGQIMLVVAALGVCIGIYDSLISRKEKLAKQKLETINEDIKNINEEMSSLEQLQTKLEEAKGNKAELAKIQNELNDAIGKTNGLINGEEKAYDAANAKLKAQIELKKQQKEQLEQNKVQHSKELFDSNTYKLNNILGIDFFAPDLNADEARKYAKKYSNLIENGMDSSSALKIATGNANFFSSLMFGILSAPNFDEKEWESYWSEQVQTAY